MRFQATYGHICFVFVNIYIIQFGIDTQNGCIIRYNVGALKRETFRTVGNMLATLIVQGGEFPRIFSNSVCQYIEADFDGCRPTIEEVPAKNVRDSLFKVFV